MNNLESLIRETYNDESLKTKFLNFAQLRGVKQDKIKHVARNYKELYQADFTDFSEINSTVHKTEIALAESEGFHVLSSSLLKILFNRYNLNNHEAWRILEAVADKYERE